VALALILFDTLGSLFTNSTLVAIFDGLSFMKRYSDFTSGIFEFSGVVFFASVSAVFIFLTVRVQEKRRWS
jgi:ABC-2 type transport system permease protein